MTGSTAHVPDCQASRVAGKAGFITVCSAKAALIDVLGSAGRHRLQHGAALGSIGRFIDRLHHRVAFFALGRFVHRTLHGVGLFPLGGFHHRPGDRVAVLAHRRLPDGLVGGHLPLLADVLVLDAIGGVLPLLVDGLVDDAIGLAGRAGQARRRWAGILRHGRRREANRTDTANTKRIGVVMVIFSPVARGELTAGRNWPTHKYLFK